MASFSFSWYFLDLCCNLLMMTYTSKASTAKMATAPNTNPILNDSNRVHISCSEFRISNSNLESVYRLRVSEERRNEYRISNLNLESFDHQIHQVGGGVWSKKYCCNLEFKNRMLPQKLPISLLVSV